MLLPLDGDLLGMVLTLKLDREHPGSRGLPALVLLADSHLGNVFWKTGQKTYSLSGVTGEWYRKEASLHYHVVLRRAIVLWSYVLLTCHVVARRNHLVLARVWRREPARGAFLKRSKVRVLFRKSLALSVFRHV